MSAKLIKVIHTTSTRGKGTEEDPLRVVNEYYSVKGELLAERDPIPPRSPFITTEKFWDAYARVAKLNEGESFNRAYFVQEIADELGLGAKP